MCIDKDVGLLVWMRVLADKFREGVVQVVQRSRGYDRTLGDIGRVRRDLVDLAGMVARIGHGVLHVEVSPPVSFERTLVQDRCGVVALEGRWAVGELEREARLELAWNSLEG